MFDPFAEGLPVYTFRNRCRESAQLELQDGMTKLFLNAYGSRENVTPQLAAFLKYLTGEDPLYEKALDIVVQAGKASASYIQRRLKIGYNRAARLVEEMEDRGIVGPANGSKPREIIHMP